MSKCNHKAWEVKTAGPTREHRTCADCKEYMGVFHSDPAPEMRLRDPRNNWVDTRLLCEWPLDRMGISADSAQVRYDDNGVIYLVYLWHSEAPAIMTMEDTKKGHARDDTGVLLRKLFQVLKG